MVETIGPINVEHLETLPHEGIPPGLLDDRQHSPEPNSSPETEIAPQIAPEMDTEMDPEIAPEVRHDDEQNEAVKIFMLDQIKEMEKQVGRKIQLSRAWQFQKNTYSKPLESAIAEYQEALMLFESKLSYTNGRPDDNDKLCMYEAHKDTYEALDAEHKEINDTVRKRNSPKKIKRHISDDNSEIEAEVAPKPARKPKRSPSDA